jgi:hypothetical protein
MTVHYCEPTEAVNPLLTPAPFLGNHAQTVEIESRPECIER